MTTSEFNPSGLKRALEDEAPPFAPADLARAASAFFSALPGEVPAVDLAPGLPRSTPPQAGAIPGGYPGVIPSIVPSTAPTAAAAPPLDLADLPLSLLPANDLPTAGNLPGLSLPLIPDPGLYFLGSPNDLTVPVQSSWVDPGAFSPQLVPAINAQPGFFDPHSVRKDFPILDQQVHGKPLVWLDNAATTQKPQSVIDRLSRFYSVENSNIHRAAHSLAARSTDAYEGAREKVRAFLNAPSVSNIAFTRGTTESINLVAQTWGRQNIGEGDEIVISWLEHHANIVPWQQLAAEKGARLRVIPVDDRGQLILEEYERLLGPKTKLVSVTQVSNALGTVTPIQEMVAIAHRHGIRILVDGAQSVSHMPVDVQALDCDFLVFSGHKIFAPTGIGVLYGKKELFDVMPPWQGGGNMIADVTFERTVYQPAPAKFEAGTGNIADAVGLGEALDYVQRLGREAIGRHEHDLIVYATDALLQVPGLRIIGTAAEKAGVISFVLEGLRSEEVGAALDKHGVAVRSGHHCAQPILRRFGVEATVRPSFAPYNTREDVDALVTGIKAIRNGR